MNTNEYSLKINNESKLININGITSNAVSIDFTGDIDFTSLVKALIKSMDSKSLLKPKDDNDTSEDNTLKLILETIDSIIDEYNKTVQALNETDNEEEQIEIDSENEVDSNDDW